MRASSAVLQAGAGSTDKAQAQDKASEAYGKAIAEALIKLREDDGFDGGFQGPKEPLDGQPRGEWLPTGSGAALTPQWGMVRPFGIGTPADYLPATISLSTFPSYAELLASREYADQVGEVQLLGEAHSAARTLEQTEIAFFWANDLNGTSKPPGQLFSITQTLARQQGLAGDEVNGLVETARLFALVAMAMADAAIVAWHVKYLFPGSGEFGGGLLRLWRPESAIHQAGDDGNPDTVADSSWQPLSAMTDGTRFSPNFPAYVSGHATFGAAHAAAMKAVLGSDSIPFTATTEDPHAVRDENEVKRTHRFNSFTEAALENGRSRVYLGVHYQWDADGGFESGIRVGEDVATGFLKLK